MYINILRHLGDVVSRKCPKKWRAKVAVSSLQCSSTPVSFGQEFLSKKQCDNTSIPPTLLTWLQLILPVPLTAVSTEGRVLLWCY